MKSSYLSYLSINISSNTHQITSSNTNAIIINVKNLFALFYHTNQSKSIKYVHHMYIRRIQPHCFTRLRQLLE